jgi:hypothetical protein
MGRNSWLQILTKWTVGYNCRQLIARPTATPIFDKDESMNIYCNSNADLYHAYIMHFIVKNHEKSSKICDDLLKFSQLKSTS